MLRSLRIFGLLLSGLVAASSWAIATNDRVDNFRLLDHTGASHELYYYNDAKAVAFLVQGNGCPIVRNAMPRFKELRDEFAEQGVEFFMINTNLQDNRESITKEVAKYGYDIPIMVDETQIIGESLNLVRTGEVFVVDPKTWTVPYHGAVDDRLTYENQKKEAENHFLRDALANMVDGKPVEVASTDGIGCLMNFPEQQAMAKAKHAEISYSEDIAPILLDNCVACHREGGLGPWAMTDYNMVRGFSLMIREVLRTQRMPPWHADPAHGTFANDRSLPPEQVQKLVHWIEAGAPRCAGPDPLAQHNKHYPVWALDEPDVIIAIPPTDVPDTGTVEYQYKFVKNPLDKDVWVRATAILPGDRQALHHVITTFAVPGPDGKLRRSGGISGGLGGYVPGMEPRNYPENTGVLLPAGAVLRFQMHYTSYGKASTDHSQLGIYLHDKPPKHSYDTTVFINTKIKIPAYAGNHSDTSTRKMKNDVLLYSLLPHAHFRGKASEFRAYYPDGSEELLLSVPNYDFNWQTTYKLAEPKLIPAGTKVVHKTWWDNSTTNPANPDPSREVPWGEQSWDEMLFGTMSYRVLQPNEREQLSISGAR